MPSEEESARFYLFMLFVAGADRGFRSLDNFVGWFVGGTAALVGLLIANLDKVSDYISAQELSFIMPWLIAAFSLVLFAKFLGSLICAKAGALEKTLELAEFWERQEWEVNRPGFRRHLAAINYGLSGGGYEREAIHR